MAIELDPRAWAQQQFGDCDLHDARRTKRLVKYAGQIAANPDMLTPDQTEDWADCKAAYRLIDSPNATFRSVSQLHWKLTRAAAPGVWLLLGDTSTIDFGTNRQVPGLSHVGDGIGYGFLLHTSLMVAADSDDCAGLAGQLIHYRKPAPDGETQVQRRRRARESDIWGDLVEDIGRPPAGVRYIHVFDAGADGFDTLGRVLRQGVDGIVRVAQRTRRITVAGETQSLCDHFATLPVAGSYPLALRANQAQAPRTAHIEVRFGLVTLPAPHTQSRWVREHGMASLTLWAIDAREINPPANSEPIHWVLYTTLPVTTYAEAKQVIDYYSKRPLIEEFHHALKSGCRLESRQFMTAKRLEVVTGVLSIAAVRLLQVRSLARTQPARAATEVVPRRWVVMLEKIRRRSLPTIRDFCRGLAQLGGFLARKSDGEPGWITLWRGFEKLELMLRGADCMERSG